MKAILQLVRWHNLLFIVFIMWLMEKMVALPVLGVSYYEEQLPTYILCLLIMGVVFIAAGGYAINDYFDVRIDAINRPEKQIVTRSISKPTAMLCHQVMTVIGVLSGIAVAIMVRSWSLGLIFVFTPGLLWFYSSSYKRQFIVGNLIVSLAAGLVPLVIAIANVALLKYRYGDILSYTHLVQDLYLWIGVFSLFAFLLTLIREIIKDMQDEAGDRELECHTLPVTLGTRWTKVIVVTLILAACGGMAYFVYLFAHTLGITGWLSLPYRYLIFGMIVPSLCDIALVIAAKIPSDYRTAQQLMKFVMFLGLLFSIVIYTQLH